MRDLKLWQEAVALAGDVVRAARQAARRETRAFTDDLMRAALAVAATIADGYARDEPVEQRRCYRGARRALSTLETALAVGRHAGIIPAPTVAQLASRTAAVSRLLTGYLTFLERQMESRRPGDAEPVA